VTALLHFVSSRLGNWHVKLPILLLGLLAPALCDAQDVGQIECARSGDYVFLYSSMVTLDVRATLQCGQQVEITGRYDNYFGVRTAKGETGYVPLESLLLLKTAPGAKPVLAPTAAPNREKLAYDRPTKPADAPSNAPSPAQALTLLDSTPVRMKIGKTISSADAQVGDDVNFEVSEDVVVDGFLVIPKGAIAIGVVNEVETKKALGRGGKLSVLIKNVRLADSEQASLRSGGEAKGSSSTAGMVIPVMHGKDITFPKGMDFTAYVNGDTRLKKEKFHAAPDPRDSAPTVSASKPEHP
jgi:hypothetical protein